MQAFFVFILCCFVSISDLTAWFNEEMNFHSAPTRFKEICCVSREASDEVGYEVGYGSFLKWMSWNRTPLYKSSAHLGDVKLEASFTQSLGSSGIFWRITYSPLSASDIVFQWAISLFILHVFSVFRLIFLVRFPCFISASQSGL